MIFILIILVAVFIGYKIGMDAGRERVVRVQQRQLAAALASSNDFYAAHSMHGLYTLQGHGERLGASFVVVKFDELQRLLSMASGGQAAPD